MAKVILQNLSKIFPSGVRAVDQINLAVADHEFVVLVGPSGCGKSTTLRMIAGLEEITSGTIQIGERIVNDVQPKDRDIAMVFQNYALYPHMTVFQNMAFGLKLRRMPKPQIEVRVREAARTLEIEHLLPRKPRELSGGQRQRVAVGRAIVREPAAFLFDEPLSNLDAKLRVSTRAEIKRLHQRLKTTTVYVTHDQEEAMTLGDRIVVMKDGIIQQADTPLRVYHYPVNRFVAGFVGMPGMNFIDGTINAENGGLTFEEGRCEAGRGLTLSGGGLRLIVSQALQDRLSGHVGRHVVLGIRPEHLDWQPRVSNAAAVNVKLGVIEPLGSDMDVYMNTALQTQLIARVKSRADVAADTEATLFVDPASAHFFEPGVTGMNLSLEDSELAHAQA